MRLNLRFTQCAVVNRDVVQLALKPELPIRAAAEKQLPARVSRCFQIQITIQKHPRLAALDNQSQVPPLPDRRHRFPCSAAEPQTPIAAESKFA